MSATLVAVNLLATLHIVWFYIDRVPSYLNLDRYAHGTERMPFQGRLLMEYPLCWAFTSPTLAHFAAWLTTLSLWLPRGVPSEDIVEFADIRARDEPAPSAGENEDTNVGCLPHANYFYADRRD